jgi:peptidoglycan-associated lipoprotein
MKTTRVVEVAASAILVAALSACANEATKPESPAPSPSASLPVAPPASKTQASGTQPQNVSASPLAAVPRTDQRSIYYDFDSFALKGQFRPIVETNAAYLKQHPGANVTIEGNCDERGSREYNLALGQRRADAVRNMLELAGVPERQVEATSFGEEKPKAAGHDEQAWSQNRRSDFDYKGQ